MKKLYLLFSLLLCAVVNATVAYADEGNWTDKYIKTVSDATNSLSEGYYLMYNVGRGTWLHENTNKTLYLSPVSGATTSSASTLPATTDVNTAFNGKSLLGYVVYLSHPSSDATTWTIQLQSGQYIPTLSHGSGMSSGTTAETFTATNVDGNYFCMLGSTTVSYDNTSGQIYMNGNGNNSYYASEGTFTGWDSSTTPGGTSHAGYLFYPVELGDLALITYNIYESTSTTAIDTEVYKLIPGTDSYPTFSETDLYSFTSSTTLPSGTLPATVTSESYDVTFTYNTGTGLPVISTSVDNATWYGIKIRPVDNGYNSGKNKWLYGSSSSSNVLLTTTTGANDGVWVADATDFTSYDDVQDNRLWCITGNPVAGFQFYNKKLGKVMAPENGSSTSNTQLVFADASASTVTTFDFVDQFTGSNDNYGCIFKVHGSTNACPNDMSSVLKLWTNDGSLTDDGCKFMFIAADDLTLEAANIPTATYTGRVGSFNFTGAQADATYTGEALFNAYKVTIKEGKYYQIRSAANSTGSAESDSASQYRYWSTADCTVQKDGTFSADDSNYARKVTRVTPSSALVPMLWYFTADGDNFKIGNANEGRLIGNCYNSSNSFTSIDFPEQETYAGVYTLNEVSGTIETWTLKSNNSPGYFVNAFQGLTNAQYLADYSRSGYTDGDDSKTVGDGGYNWYIIPVETIPLTIYDDTQYASACYPFAVELPTGVKAYTVSKADGSTNEATLTEVTTQTTDGNTLVPASTPVFITATSDATYTTGTDTKIYTLTISSSDKKAPEGNKLLGSTVARKGITASTADNATDYVYVLATNGTNAVLKKNGSVTTMPANKAYLPAENVSSVSGSNALYFNFDEATSIDAIAVDAANDATNDVNAYYDLNGRRVLYPAHGIFVKSNGQKVYVK